MFTDAITLFDQTIVTLETLAAVLADELDERVHQARLMESEERGLIAYRAAQTRIGSLLPALRAARMAQEHAARGARHSMCIDCD